MSLYDKWKSIIEEQCNCGCSTCEKREAEEEAEKDAERTEAKTAQGQEEDFLMPKQNGKHKFGPDKEDERRHTQKLLLGRKLREMLDAKRSAVSESEDHAETFDRAAELDAVAEAVLRGMGTEAIEEAAKKPGGVRQAVRGIIARRSKPKPPAPNSKRHSPYKNEKRIGQGPRGGEFKSRSNTYSCAKDPADLGIKSQRLLRRVQQKFGGPRKYKQFCINVKRLRNAKDPMSAIFVVNDGAGRAAYMGRAEQEGSYNGQYWNWSNGCVPQAGRAGLRGSKGQYGRPNCLSRWEQ